MQRIISIIISFCLIIGLCSTNVDTASAKTVDINDYSCIIVDAADIISADQIEQNYVVDKRYNTPFDGAPYPEQYADFGCYYYWQLGDFTNEEKAFYNQLYSLCLAGLSSPDSMLLQSYKGRSYTPGVRYQNMTRDSAIKVMSIMMLEHPEFFYINQYFLLTHDNSSSSGLAAYGVYDFYVDPSDRVAAKKDFFNEVYRVYYAIKDAHLHSAEEELKYLNDLICAYTEYQVGDHDQSAYGVFIDHKAVCSGYSEAFAIVANMLGYQTLCVTSDSHEWNITKISWNWYNVDTVVNDYPVPYRLFLKSDQTTRAFDTTTKAHVPESFWTSLPTCPEDFLLSSSSLAVDYPLPTTGADVAPASIIGTSSADQETSESVSSEPEPDPVIEPAPAVEPEPTIDLLPKDPTQDGSQKPIKPTPVTDPDISSSDPVQSDDPITVITDDPDDLKDYVPDEELSKNVSPVYRLYNSNTSEHFYTLNQSEMEHLSSIGWDYEGIAWYVSNLKSKNTVPVQRLYNPNSGEHHYTTSVNEAKNLTKLGWIWEGIAWNSASGPDTWSIYRLYNPNAKGIYEAGAHFYTQSNNEKLNLINEGWIYEGISWLSF